MKLVKLSTVAIFLISSLLVSCNKFGFVIYGEGAVVSDTLYLDDFNAIELLGADDVVISYGTTQSVTGTGNPNIIERLKTDVNNNTWKIELEWGTYVDYELTVYITIPDISSIKLTGSGDIIVGDFNNQGDLDLRITGSGDIELNAFENCPKLSVDITGSGDVEAKKAFSMLETLDINIIGSGSYIGYPVVSSEAYIDIVGSGNCYVSTTDVLDVDISGSGDVYYKGNPAVILKVTGPGDVINKN